MSLFPPEILESLRPGIVSFTVHGQPQTAGSKRSFVVTNRKTGQPIRRPNGSIIVNTVDDNPKSKDWKTQVAEKARAAFTGPLMQGPLKVYFAFTVPRPKGHYGAKGLKASAPVRPAVKPDLLKLARAVEDALTGVIWQDDAQIVQEHLAKNYGTHAYVEIQIEAVV